MSSSAYGPATTNISEPKAGVTRRGPLLGRHLRRHWDGTFDDSSPAPSNATVEVYSYNQLIASFGPEHLASTNRTWDVLTIEWPSLSITALNNVYTTRQTGGSCFP